VTQPLRVLLIEDHPDLAAATAGFLEAEGLDVRTALSGHEALEIAPAFQPQLLLCDLHLPDMSGLDVVHELRSNPSTERTYVVILTGTAAMDSTEVDVDFWMVKPMTTEALHRVLRRVSLKIHNSG